MVRGASCRYLLAGLLAAGLLLAAESPLQRAHRKLDRLENDLVPLGSKVTFTEVELNAFAREQAGIIAPGALRDIRLRVISGGAEARGMINLLKVRQATGKDSNWLIDKMLDGERPILVRTRIQSHGGRARVDVERLEISGIALEGRTLQIVIDRFLIPSFPDARLGRWFELGHEIERLDTFPGEAIVRMNPSHTR